MHPFLSVPLFVKNSQKQGVFAYNCKNGVLKLVTHIAVASARVLGSTSDLITFATRSREAEKHTDGPFHLLMILAAVARTFFSILRQFT